MIIKQLFLVLLVCTLGGVAQAATTASVADGPLAPLSFTAPNGFKLTSVTPAQADSIMFGTVVGRYHSGAYFNTVSFNPLSFAENSEIRRAGRKQADPAYNTPSNPWHLYNISNSSGTVISAVWYGRCPNNVMPDNHYKALVEKAYAVLGMGTIGADGVCTPDADHHFAHFVPIVPDSLPTDQREAALLAIVEYAAQLAIQGACLPLGGKLPKGLSVHLHPNSIDVAALAKLGFSVIQPEGTPADRWLWNVAPDSEFKEGESDRRVMLVHMGVGAR